MNRRVTLLLLGTIAAVCAGAAEWPVLRTYEGEALRRVKKIARLLEGPILPEEYEGWEGCSLPNHGYPRFAKATFRTAYPLAQVELEDPQVPVRVSLAALPRAGRRGRQRPVRAVSDAGSPALRGRGDSDGRKRNPFDEAECGHHYARALAAWSVLKAWERTK